MLVPKILMYSFKGGAGRTVSTANVAYVLAKELGKRVLVVDLDVESAGASVLFGVDKDVQDGRLWAIQDVLRGEHTSKVEHAGVVSHKREKIQLYVKDFEQSIWTKLHRQVFRDEGRGSLDFVPARTIVTSSSEVKVGSKQGIEAFQRLQEKIDNLDSAPQIVMFDSASGVQDSALLGLRTCTVLVIFCRWSRQFVSGTEEFLRHYIVSRKAAGVGRIHKVLVVPTAVPRTLPGGLLATELRARQERLKETLRLLNMEAERDWRKPGNWIELVEPIHECPALKWDDRVFLMDVEYQRGEGVSEALQDYRLLADRLDRAILAP